MSIKISFKKNILSKYIKNYVLFVNEGFKINGLSKIQLKKDSTFINQVINSSVIKKKKFFNYKFKFFTKNNINKNKE